MPEILHVQDASALYLELVRNGVEIWHKLAERPWGMREFAIVAPDVHRMVFGERIAPPPEAAPRA